MITLGGNPLGRNDPENQDFSLKYDGGKEI
jgi:hypothetical protein